MVAKGYREKREVLERLLVCPFGLNQHVFINRVVNLGIPSRPHCCFGHPYCIPCNILCAAFHSARAEIHSQLVVSYWPFPFHDTNLVTIHLRRESWPFPTFFISWQSASDIGWTRIVHYRPKIYRHLRCYFRLSHLPDFPILDFITNGQVHYNVNFVISK